MEIQLLTNGFRFTWLRQVSSHGPLAFEDATIDSQDDGCLAGPKRSFSADLDRFRAEQPEEHAFFSKGLCHCRPHDCIMQYNNIWTAQGGGGSFQA